MGNPGAVGPSGNLGPIVSFSFVSFSYYMLSVTVRLNAAVTIE